MAKVSIPYSTQEGTLSMQQVVWPEQCPCCKSKDVSAEYGLSLQAERTSLPGGAQTRTVTYYPLSWSVPHCQACVDHAGSASMMGIAAFGVWLALLLIAIFVLPDLSTRSQGVRAVAWILLLVVPILPAWIAYKVLVRRVADAKRKPGCINRHWAVSASSEKGHVIFTFDDDEYAALFAAMNGREADQS
jgi:hypothetical protein